MKLFAANFPLDLRMDNFNVHLHITHTHKHATPFLVNELYILQKLQYITKKNLILLTYLGFHQMEPFKPWTVGRNYLSCIIKWRWFQVKYA